MLGLVEKKRLDRKMYESCNKCLLDFLHITAIFDQVPTVSDIQQLSTPADPDITVQ